MKKSILVIMAGGMGSRYGGLKQIDPIDEEGNLIIDYSLYDAKKAGFEDVVFIINHGIEQEFRRVIGSRIEQVLGVSYVYQELNALPDGFTIPDGRIKPWGTAHAILCCKELLDGPFAVINADDYYGYTGFRSIYDFLSEEQPDDGHYRIGMVGYQLDHTLTEHGHVSRGICEVDDRGILQGVKERTHIVKRTDGVYFTEDDGQSFERLADTSIASMNMWGFPASILQEIETGFTAFLEKRVQDNPLKCEYFLPQIVNDLIEQNKAVVQVLPTQEQWYGVTYQADKAVVTEAVGRMKKDGIYPESLWGTEEQDSQTGQDILCVLAQFSLPGRLMEMNPYGNGHINDTYLVKYMESKALKQYILQRMNIDIFKNIPALMENIVGVTEYLGQEIRKRNGNTEREALQVVRSRTGEAYAKDLRGACWRIYQYVEDSICLEQVESQEDFYRSGEAFGRFQGMLAGYPAETLHETIADFHNTPVRYANFERAVKEDVCHRAKQVAAEIEFAKARRAEASICVEMLARGELPLRVTHNDTKLNNILFDAQTRQALCIIDLDTVMPGLSVNDFGDSIRFGASTAVEDERDLTKVYLDLELYEAYVRGYLKGCGGTLLENEIAMLSMGAKLMTYECGLRFLTDHLQGDTYFKISRAGQNLDRARTQFKLVADMEEKWHAMCLIVQKVKNEML